MINVAVFYWKDPKYLLLGLPGSPISKPTPEEVETKYKLVWTGEMPEETTLDDIFYKFNTQTLRLPEGVHHTSMSVGDIIRLGGNFHICMPVGWEVF